LKADAVPFFSWDKDKQEKVQAVKRYASEKMNQSRKENEATDSAESEEECVTLVSTRTGEDIISRKGTNILRMKSVVN